MSSLNSLPGKLEIVSLQNRWLNGTECEQVSQCLRTGVIFLSILGEQMRKRGERETRVAREGRIAKISTPHVYHYYSSCSGVQI